MIVILQRALSLKSKKQPNANLVKVMVLSPEEKEDKIRLTKEERMKVNPNSQACPLEEKKMNQKESRMKPTLRKNPLNCKIIRLLMAQEN